MGNLIGHARTTITFENTTDCWLVVGNYDQIISQHRTEAAARAGIELIGNDGPDGLAETPWATVAVVAPGASISGTLLVPIMSDDPEDNKLPEWFPVFNAE